MKDSEFNRQGSVFGDEGEFTPASSLRFQELSDWFSAQRTFHRNLEVVLQQFDLTAQQYVVLLEISLHQDRGGFAIKHLSAKLGIRHNSAVQFVDALCAKQYVRRTPSTRDRRVVDLRLTPTGERLLRELVQTHWQSMHSGGSHARHAEASPDRTHAAAN